MNDHDQVQGLQLRVFFDGDCGLCRRVAAWLDAQPKFVPVECVAAQAADGDSCPLSVQELLGKVTLIASDGAVYRGTNAWLVCLWALRNYRAWSLRLSGPALRPWAERLFATITQVAAWTKAPRLPSQRVSH